LYVIRENRDTGERVMGLLRWGLIPHGCTDPDGGRKPINARAESVAQLPTFRAAYSKRRCIVSVDCFFEWRVVEGAPGAKNLRRGRQALTRPKDDSGSPAMPGGGMGGMDY
jgi:putative SOS response-associated peptidase YedK